MCIPDDILARYDHVEGCRIGYGEPEPQRCPRCKGLADGTIVKAAQDYPILGWVTEADARAAAKEFVRRNRLWKLARVEETDSGYYVVLRYKEHDIEARFNRRQLAAG